MGTGNSKNEKKIEFNNKEIYNEAYGMDLKEVRGVDVNKIEDAYEKIGKGLFKEEIIEFADESGPVQQWVRKL